MKRLPREGIVAGATGAATASGWALLCPVLSLGGERAEPVYSWVAIALAIACGGAAAWGARRGSGADRALGAGAATATVGFVASMALAYLTSSSGQDLPAHALVAAGLGALGVTLIASVIAGSLALAAGPGPIATAAPPSDPFRVAMTAVIALAAGDLLLAGGASAGGFGNPLLVFGFGGIALAAAAALSVVAVGTFARPIAHAAAIASATSPPASDPGADPLPAAVIRLHVRLETALADDLAGLPKGPPPSVFEQRRELFLAVVGDELRAPLREIGTVASGLIGGGRLTAPQSEDVTLILSGCGELLGLVEMVLSPAAGGDGIETRHETVDLGALVKDVARAQRPTVEEKGITLAVEVEGEVNAWGDPRRLRQVVTNLVANAVKFTDAGAVRLSVRRNGGWIEVEVRDQGPGIAEAEVERLFQRFEQAGDERRQGRGTGLGLSIAKRIVEEQGGTLTVETRVGEGSAFSFRVPAAARRAAAPPASASTDLPPTSPPIGSAQSQKEPA